VRIKYIKNTLITEYINIFKLVRTPILYDFVCYFKTINERFDSQNIDTKLHMDDYLEKAEDISQDILITMVFNISTKMEDIEKLSEKIFESIKVNNMDVEIFNMIEK
jgi:hypothetical protein